MNTNVSKEIIKKIEDVSVYFLKKYLSEEKMFPKITDKELKILAGNILNPMVVHCQRQAEGACVLAEHFGYDYSNNADYIKLMATGGLDDDVEKYIDDGEDD